jgi:hypothetical protein
MMLAVDFTASNATQDLHRLSDNSRERALAAAVTLESLKDATGDCDASTTTDEALLTGLNEYQKVILSVGSVIEEYDTDKMIPFLGFGAKVPALSRSKDRSECSYRYNVILFQTHRRLSTLLYCGPQQLGSERHAGYYGGVWSMVRRFLFKDIRVVLHSVILSASLGSTCMGPLILLPFCESA